MVLMKSDIQVFGNEDLQESFFRLKEADCVLYSQEGTKFKIHKEILCQTRFSQFCSLKIKSFTSSKIKTSVFLETFHVIK